MYIVASLELGAAPKPDARDVKEFMAKGAAKCFLSEIARFRKKMGEEKFATLTLAVVFLDVETESPAMWKTKEHPQGTPLLSDLVELPCDGRARRRSEGDARGVQCFARDRRKHEDNKTPITAHCSFVFLAQSDTKAALRTLSFDIYLQDLSPQKNTILTYPWKVEKVRYK
jgi:hypothetical protein